MPPYSHRNGFHSADEEAAFACRSWRLGRRLGLCFEGLFAGLKFCALALHRPSFCIPRFLSNRGPELALLFAFVVSAEDGEDMMSAFKTMLLLDGAKSAPKHNVLSRYALFFQKLFGIARNGLVLQTTLVSAILALHKDCCYVAETIVSRGRKVWLCVRDSLALAPPPNLLPWLTLQTIVSAIQQQERPCLSAMHYGTEANTATAIAAAIRL